MSHAQAAFPDRSALWRGVVMGTIAHAIWVAPNPSLAVLQQWDGRNYTVNDVASARGTITFAEDCMVAAFRDERSRHRAAPPRRGAGQYAAEYYFQGAPAEVLMLARNEALQYLFDDWQGGAEPVITAAFWSEGPMLTATEPWTAVLEHGAHLLQLQLLPPERGIPAWEQAYELSPEQRVLLGHLSERRLAQPDGVVAMTPAECQALTAVGDAGIEESRELLAAVGISVG
jgi:hypothetical protein